MAADIRQKLIGLLDYVEQVVRLDERVAFKLSEYHLPDGTTFIVSQDDTQSLPGVRHDHNDEDGPVWLEVDRLSRKEPPARPDTIADWIAVSSDPAKAPDIRSERLITVTAVEKDAAIASGTVRTDDVLEAPRKRGELAAFFCAALCQFCAVEFLRGLGNRRRNSCNTLSKQRFFLNALGMVRNT